MNYLNRNKQIALGLIISGMALLVASVVNQPEAEVASWYGPGFEGNRTASGETFDSSQLTAAHKTLPFGTKLLVKHEGKGVTVTVNDRGPYTSGRDIDLSQAAAQKLDIDGVAAVEVIPLGVEAEEPKVDILPQTGGIGQ